MNLDELIRQIHQGDDLNAQPHSRRKKLTVDEIMRRARAEIARRKNFGTTSVANIGLPAEGANDRWDNRMPRWAPAVSRLPNKKEYRLAEILSFSDADFIEQCFRIVLRRSPDPEGFEFFLGALRRGGLSKVEILGAIRFSPEGMRHEIHVDGLLIPYTLRKWMRVPVIGPALRWLHGLVHLGESGVRQQLLDTAQDRESQHIGQLINTSAVIVENRFASVESKLSEFARNDVVNALIESLAENAMRIDAIGASIEQVNAAITSLRDDNSLKAERSELGKALIALSTAESHIAENQSRLSSIESNIPDFVTRSEAAEHVAQLTSAQQTIIELRDRSAHFVDQSSLAAVQETAVATEAKFNEISLELSGLSAITEQMREDVEAMRLYSQTDAGLEPDSLDALYADFEDRFRGSRDLIRARIEPYLQWVRDAGAGKSETPILDVGCGRGEWLELLRDNQLMAHGIDLNRFFVKECEGRALTVDFGDAITVMRRMPDASFGAVTSMHLIEHLPFEKMIALIDEAKRILCPGGLLILETPNPENISVGSCSFYLDPTHRNPVPPDLLRWMVEERGFHAARIERLTHHREIPWPGRVADDVPGGATINAMSDAFVAAPDYAVLANRP